MKLRIIILAAPLLLSSCGTTDEPDHTITAVNQSQESEIVRIVSVSPTKIKETNNHNKNLASTIGSLLGIAGAIAAVEEDHGSGWEAAGAGLGGAAAGSSVGSALVSDTRTVNGVQVSFKRKTGQVLSTVETGKACQFQVGADATLTKIGATSINVIPNASCHKKKS